MAEIHFEPEPGSKDAMPNLAPPKPMLRVAVAMVVMVFTMAVLATRFGIGKAADIYENPVAQRSLSFEDAEDGGILVRDGDSRDVALTLPSGTNGFLRGALRAMADRRRVASQPYDAPFLLTAWGDGRITIEDPLTGQRVAVSSFGPTQVKSFVALLDRDGTVFADLEPSAR
jgi:putative photosynthetic complex assembly protein